MYTNNEPNTRSCVAINQWYLLLILSSLILICICIILFQNTGGQTTNTGLGQNPCTVTNIGKGNLYFIVATDKTKFIECDLNGNANVLTCPSQLVWDQTRLSCVYNFQLGMAVTTPNPNALTGKYFQLFENPLSNTDLMTFN